MAAGPDAGRSPFAIVVGIDACYKLRFGSPSHEPTFQASVFIVQSWRSGTSRMRDRAPIKVRISDLNKSFGSNHVLRDVSFDVPAGKKSVIIGPAASGKSVLMKCLVGLYPPESGAIWVDERDLTRLKGRERTELIEKFGMLFQSGGLFDSLPVWENIAFKLINRH
ncbi:MAG: ATP-binding cassette domain-containing protein, partial [Alphaproteobacteria bacterium]